MIPAYDAGGSRMPTDTDRKQTRKIKVVASGGLGTLLVSSILQALNLVPQHLQNEMHGATATLAAIGIFYLIIPRKARITLEWER